MSAHIALSHLSAQLASCDGLGCKASLFWDEAMNKFALLMRFADLLERAQTLPPLSPLRELFSLFADSSLNFTASLCNKSSVVSIRPVRQCKGQVSGFGPENSISSKCVFTLAISRVLNHGPTSFFCPGVLCLDHLRFSPRKSVDKEGTVH